MAANQNPASLQRSNTNFASTEELEQRYGRRAAEVLNESHCKLEDELKRYQATATVYARQATVADRTIKALVPHIATYQAADRTIRALVPHINRYNNMEQLLSDPTRLAKYTVDMFTHVYPVQAKERPSATQPLVRPDFPSMPSARVPGNVRLGDVRPDQRWMVADRMEKAGLMRGKPIVNG